jgi:NAD(P)-dependent dehydrogenase (short-subunit alcohol dehydrogenase family)
MRVFVAGATGAIGRRLVPQLVEAGHRVTAITRSKEKLGLLSDLGAEAVVCDVFDAGRLGSVVARTEPDAVINQLTELPQSLNPRKLKEYYAANNLVRREGTRNLLDAARGAGVSRFIVPHDQEKSNAHEDQCLPAARGVKDRRDPHRPEDDEQGVAAARRHYAEEDARITDSKPLVEHDEALHPDW